MPISALQQFNWVDIFVVIVLIRISYVSLRSGFAVELFKLLGAILAVFLSCHYYVLAANFLSANIASAQVLAKFFMFFAFVTLALAGYVIFVGLRVMFGRFIKMEATPKLNKWGGLILGSVRGVLAVGLIMVIFAVSPLSYFKHSVKHAYSGRQLFNLAAGTYGSIWHTIVSKFSPNEKFNKDILSLQEELSVKSTKL